MFYELGKKFIDDSKPNQQYLLRLVSGEVEVDEIEGNKLPSGIVKVENDARTSIIRRLDTEKLEWIRAYQTEGARRSRFWYGHKQITVHRDIDIQDATDLYPLHCQVSLQDQ